MTVPWILARRHASAHWTRTALTMTGMVLGLLLFCLVVSIETSMSSAVAESSANRLVVQSGVSLFVQLPLDYQAKIASVPGVEEVSKFQYFGGYYQQPTNYFTQFAVDHDRFLDMYERDIEIVAGPGDETGAAARAAVERALAEDRLAAIVGLGLGRDYGFRVGTTVPVISTLFPRADGGAWDFHIVGTYRPRKSNVDDRTLFFRFDYLEEAQLAGRDGGLQSVGTYVVDVAPGAPPEEVIAGIDRLFEAGPQATRTSTEAAFQAGFLSMLGNLPLFVSTIGGAIVFAVLFSVVNTMLMAGRQRLHEAGVLKALGFRDAAVGAVMIAEATMLALVGGGAGCALAALLAPGIREQVGVMVPNFTVAPATIAAGLALSLAIGIIAGLGPALTMARVRPTEALRSDA